MSMLMEAEFWVAVAFVIFLALMLMSACTRSSARSTSAGAHQVGTRRGAPAQERGEALLAEYQKKKASRAGGRRDHRRRQGRCRAARGRGRGEARDFVARRTKMAETKIAQAERRPWPMCAAPQPKPRSPRPRRCWRSAAKGSVAGQSIARGIEDVKKKLN